MPIIQKRIKSYLADDLFKEEFSHTLLHNQDVFEEFKKAKDRFSNLASAQEREETSEADTTISSLFHPPTAFTEEGGEEDFYKHELSKLVNGIQLDNSVSDISQQELEPDGIDCEQPQNEPGNSEAGQNDQFDDIRALREPIEQVHDAQTFSTYMTELYGEQVFEAGLQIVKNHKTQIFQSDGREVLHQELS